MFDAGWVKDAELLEAGGTFCLTCAHHLGIVRLAEQCVWCATPMADAVSAETLGWAYFADELGALHPCCPACLSGRFGIADRFRLRGAL